MRAVPRNSLSAESRFEITAFGQDCSDMGMETLSNMYKCEEAAKEIGAYYEYDDTYFNYPKGCFIFSDTVRWNNHKIGAKYIWAQAICRCKYNPTILYKFKPYTLNY